MSEKELKDSLNKKDVELHLLRDPIYCDNTIKFMQNNCKSLMNQINTYSEDMIPQVSGNNIAIEGACILKDIRNDTKINSCLASV